MTWTEQVARPNGTVYRARRSAAVESFGGYGLGASDPTGMLVTRTHDVDVAVALVESHWRSEFGGPLPTPEPLWVRLVPWSDQGYDSTWLRVDPTERGAIPAVEFLLGDC